MVHDWIRLSSYQWIWCVALKIKNKVDNHIVFPLLFCLNTVFAFSVKKSVQLKQILIQIYESATINSEQLRFFLQHHYVVSAISLIARCDCNGHGNGLSCPLNVLTGNRKCECLDNTCGDRCEKCCPAYNQYPWLKGSRTSWISDNTTACTSEIFMQAVISSYCQFSDFLFSRSNIKEHSN